MVTLEEVAKGLGTGRKLAVFHPNADCDAVGSAVALVKNFPDFEMGAPGGVGRLGKKILELSGIEAPEKPDYSAYDTLVVLDTCNLGGLFIPEDVLSSKRKIVIDHHMRAANVEADMYYSDETKPSCAEIAKGVLEAAGKKADRPTALALAMGIITDTAHFRFAKSSTLRTMVGILEEGSITLEEVLILVEDDTPDVSKKIAFLKGAQRVRFEQTGEYVVALSNVSAFEGALSKNLLSLGADVVFVGAQVKTEFRVSGRATQSLVRKGFHIGKLMDETGREMGGQGGGHAGAAGMSGEGEMEAALNILAEKALVALGGLRDRRG